MLLAKLSNEVNLYSCGSANSLNVTEVLMFSKLCRIERHSNVHKTESASVTGHKRSQYAAKNMFPQSCLLITVL